jgi:hypothetical protein
MNILLDETRSPPLRQVIGRLMSAATHVDFAVSNVRLAVIDVSAAETSGLESCRFLLARLDAQELGRFRRPGEERRPALLALQGFLASGRVQIRSAGTAAWHPDFSIYRGLRGRAAGDDAACLIGAHYFYQPVVAGGPSLTCMMTHASAIRSASDRFEELWQRGHDVAGVVQDTLTHALGDPA